MFTGLSGAGKTTISQQVQKGLEQKGYKVKVLDGDIIRKTMTKHLGYSINDRKRNMKLIGKLAKQLTNENYIVLVSIISPFEHIRNEMREHIKNFIEVYVNAPLTVCETRDVKGLYKKAREGQISNFTGIDSPYEPPCFPEVECLTHKETIKESTQKVLNVLNKFGYTKKII